MHDWFDDFRLAVTFLTRVPLAPPPGPVDVPRAMRLFPLVAAVIGLAAALFDLALLRLGLPPLAAAALTLGASAWLTGALHEDGLGDVADGFGGGRDIAAKLAIMKDSRLGSYGMLALITSFAARLAALAALPLHAVVPALVVAHALARSPLPALALLLPPARSDGLAASAGRPDQATVLIALAIGLLIAVICLPLGTALLAMIMTVAGATAVGWLARRQIGGYTGDVLGAAEQVVEVLVLLLLSVRLA
ncbi:adenosylcobinamide-GDP ribazoletransferase [Bradyrhizobium sp. U87765 SZCCT0131]|uniref:adenosylcobinamide-GDP ribazoletransferase n=1 Tax=unclassified Bradyrhizobium TaxID=2631580 RepID=UPI001BAD623D|nr:MULTISPECIES: adenosylcobinamide-GDP ribazoletransferase [unclassified Bradyrhizobium]MBR1217462.1 adenosylcobinamide-GDP ribazoletransferase [Bradyrhizobium sp. U87765 SZCCT0131]MBR1264941.1 adenosylcobinamide-GDP ribazoletransferase [Bradyrhizobium sp. U87765 SZCCT0134]MBR1304923.1 adenosylcobinamide-GDP ribazoletransferase [Bradyrhizobium sp. U87765 SZCCT0110]MBR1320709.1 adenosylcobinamide-GDP ribazoletransferase [Bradyrhizobium sp. U87765 SZCCT0109]MBR1349129.1 adenosylcobinamide-GDP r